MHAPGTLLQRIAWGDGGLFGGLYHADLQRGAIRGYDFLFSCVNRGDVAIVISTIPTLDNTSVSYFLTPHVIGWRTGSDRDWDIIKTIS